MVHWFFRSQQATDARAVRPEFIKHLRGECHVSSDFHGCAVVFGELVSNVIRHAPGSIEIDARADTNGVVTLSVGDTGPGFKPELRLPEDPLSERGRGMYIVSKICHRVSVEQVTGMNRVCAVLPVVDLPRQNHA